jgi:hypothetical protein
MFHQPEIGNARREFGLGYLAGSITAAVVD